MTINFVAVFVAALASWMVGAAWYTALGKVWTAALGWKDEDKPKSMPIAPMVICFVAELVMAAMLAGLMGHFGTISVKVGVISAITSWVAFIATTTVVNNAFQRRSFTLSLIDGGHWLIVLVLQGIVIGLFG